MVVKTILIFLLPIVIIAENIHLKLKTDPEATFDTFFLTYKSIFDETDNILIIYDTEIDSFIHFENKTISLLNINENFDEMKKLNHNFDLNLIIVKNLEKLVTFLDAMQSFLIWKSDRRTLVLYFGESAQEISDIFWTYYIVNIGIVLENRLEEVFTYFPFENKHCGFPINPKIIKINDFSMNSQPSSVLPETTEKSDGYSNPTNTQKSSISSTNSRKSGTISTNPQKSANSTTLWNTSTSSTSPHNNSTYYTDSGKSGTCFTNLLKSRTSSTDSWKSGTSSRNSQKGSASSTDSWRSSTSSTNQHKSSTNSTHSWKSGNSSTDSGKNGTISSNIFVNKVPQKFNNCQIRACVTLSEPYTLNIDEVSENSSNIGFESTFVNFMFKKLNLTRNVTKRYIGDYFTLKNNTFLGPYLDLLTNKCDIAYGHMWISPYHHIFLDNTHFSYQDFFYWLVPAAKRDKQWKSLIKTFNLTVWGSLLITICLFITAWWWVSREGGKFKFGWFALYGWYSFLNGSVPGTNRNIIFLFWIFFVLIVNTVYQSRLLSILTTPLYEHQISTLQELANSTGIKIYYLPQNIEVHRTTDIWYYKKMYSKGTDISMETYTWMRKNHQENSALIAADIRTRYLFKKHFLYPDNQPKVFAVKNGYYYLILTIYTRKGYPLLKKFNTILQRVQQNGLYDKWVRDTLPSIDKPSKLGPTKINTVHLAGAFFLYLIGIFLSLIVFLGEKFVEYARKRKNGVK